MKRRTLVASLVLATALATHDAAQQAPLPMKISAADATDQHNRQDGPGA